VGQVGYHSSHICLRFIGVSISIVINYLHAFGCVEVGLGIACVNLSPWSDNGKVSV